MTEFLFTGEQLGRLALQFLLAGAGTLSFAILFACPRRTLPYCGLVGAVGWLVYEIAELFGMEAFAASLLAVIPLTLLARILAITLRTPVTVFLLTGIFPLVPGAGIYYSAYYFIQGDNALALARYFKAHPLVEQVFYPGLEDDPHHELAARYLRHGFGCVLSVVLKGDKRQTESLVDHLRLVSHLANVGDNRTLIIQPAATTHSQLSEEEQRAAGVLPTLLRISAGIEHIDDLIRDFEQAFFYVKA